MLIVKAPITDPKIAAEWAEQYPETFFDPDYHAEHLLDTLDGPADDPVTGCLSAQGQSQ